MQIKRRHIDLHLHSTYSDGCLSPAELVKRAAERDIRVISLTDHDNIGGLEEAVRAGEVHGVEVIPGVELSAEFEPGTLHILGYFFDPRHSGLGKTLRALQEERERRNHRMVERFRELGIVLSYEELLKLAGGEQVGRPHFARALVERGVVRCREEAFRKFLAKGAPGYLDKKRLTANEAIRLIHEAGGLAVLAHPKMLYLKAEAFDRKLKEFVDEGLDGIEAHSTAHEPKDAKFFRRMATQYQLLITGGSDFHGDTKHGSEIGILGDRRLNDRLIQEMKERLASRRPG